MPLYSRTGRRHVNGLSPPAISDINITYRWKEINMTMAEILMVGGRALLALLFILAGITKIAGPKPVLDHMRQEHVPTFLLPLVIVVEIGAGAALLIGWHTMIAATVLSAFCIATAIVFHRNFTQRAERTQFVKDLALAGALAFVAAQAMT
jgi:putative oxidoreductase